MSAIAYVLRNYAHHTGGAQRDRFSSAVVRTVLAVPVGWLLRKGRWRVRTSPRPDD